jgi:hypothetical protein
MPFCSIFATIEDAVSRVLNGERSSTCADFLLLRLDAPNQNLFGGPFRFRSYLCHLERLEGKSYQRQSLKVDALRDSVILCAL